MPSTPHPLLWLERALWVTGTVALGVVVWVLAVGAVHEHRSERLLERRLAQARIERAQDEVLGQLEARAERPLATARDTTPFPARLEIPRLGLSVTVDEGTEASVLRRAAGHVRGSALPGSEGHVALAAHRDRHFRSLERIEEGDEIHLESPAGSARYRVESTRIVSPTAVEVLDPTPYPALSLVTCYPFDFLGPAPRRFVVRARRVEPAASGGAAAAG